MKGGRRRRRRRYGVVEYPTDATAGVRLLVRWFIRPTTFTPFSLSHLGRTPFCVVVVVAAPFIVLPRLRPSRGWVRFSQIRVHAVSGR